jgi:deoxyadenosine/deoxycytidine kinase
MTQKHVIIAGNIGVGKTSLVSLLSDKLEWLPYFEPEAANPYLSDFYKDMHGWSFHSQVFFLSRRLKSHYEISQYARTVLQDRSVYEDAEIFAKNLHLQGYITARDFCTYCELYKTLLEFLPPPDLVIYLRASVPVLIKRIRQRGRDYEKNISSVYLEDLNKLYESWIAEFTLCPVLTIPADNMDFVEKETHLELIINKIQEKLTGKEIVDFYPEEID